MTLENSLERTIMKLYVLAVLAAVFYQNLIPVYSWTHVPSPERGAKMQKRWENFKAILVNDRTIERITPICGRWNGGNVHDDKSDGICTKLIGRPKDAESEACDAYCCHLGFLTGYCHTKVGVKIGFKLESKNGGSGLVPVPIVLPKLSAGCDCSNDWRDATCGPDGSFLGIRCPFDRSACQRKCCRSGKSGGKCGGFLKTKCKCS